MKLYLIAGHGAGDSGAVGNGYQEAERVRKLCEKIKQYGGDKVVYLDPNINYYASKKISTLSIASDGCILECHMDSGAAGAKGGHVIIPAGVGGADKYDRALAAFMASYFPGRANTIVERGDLANPNRAKARGFNYRLVEFGFISNAGDVAKFNGGLDTIAKKVLECFGIGTANKAGWIQDKVGWWYRNDDGTYPKLCWKKIKEEWYYFDERGYALQNQWTEYKGHKYYLGEDCKMYVGWHRINGNWYYFDKTDGLMVTNQIVESNGKYYFMKADGKMAAGEEITFNTNADGVMTWKQL